MEEEEKEQEEEEKEEEKVEEGKAHEMLIFAGRGALQARGCPEHIPWELLTSAPISTSTSLQCCLGWCFSVSGFRRMKSKSWQET